MSRWLMTDPEGRAGPRRRGAEKLPRARCAECRQMTFTELLTYARRLAGGTHTRAPRAYDSRICDQCRLSLQQRLANIGHGPRVFGSAHWLVSSLLRPNP